MQVPILTGIYSRAGPDFEQSVPLNMVPNAEDTGISKGYLRSAPGIVQQFTSGQGIDGGGLVWDGILYRLSGTHLIKVGSDGSVTFIGDIAGSGQGGFALSFDRLAIARGNKLYYTNGATVTQVTDVDLGTVLDVTWMDGYFITTDGNSIVVTELNDPTQVDPLKYGSAEADPDSVVGLLAVRGELYALGKYTVEVFRNAGLTGFPFQRQRGAQVDIGLVGTHAKCLFRDSFAYVGRGINQTPRVYVYRQGSAVGVSSKALDRQLGELTDDELASIIVEARHGKTEDELLVHLPDVTWVYSQSVSEALEQLVWYRLGGGVDGSSVYPARNFLFAYGEWQCGHVSSAALGRIDTSVATVFGEAAAWQFDTIALHSEGKGAICHDLELVGQFGWVAADENPQAFMSWSDDGVTYSQERATRIGGPGERAHRLAWRRNGYFRQWRAFRFRGVSSSPLSFARLEVSLEPLGDG